MSRKKAFVLGNGTSRQKINHHKLKEHGTVYGCNGLYREFVPDHLVAVDTKMIIEIAETGYHAKHSVWSNRNKLTEKHHDVKIMEPNKGWSSGPTALLLASQHEHKQIFILGFDYVGIGKDKERVNNIYAGTRNYKKLEDRATYYGNWQRQTMMCINQYPRTKYYRVLETAEDYIPDHLKDLSNLSHITIDDFNKIYG
jgi:hypothetical protein